MKRSAPALLAEVWRGDVVESRHFGRVAAIDGQGRVVLSIGNPELPAYLRSSAKPFQAIPLLASGAAARFNFSQREVAIACGSHDGTPEHMKTVAGMLGKIGVAKTALKCGVHEPFDKKVAQEDLRSGRPFDVLQNNCSGKHTGMLAFCLHAGEPIETYDVPDSLLQQSIHETVARFANLPMAEVHRATDGCGVPTFALPVENMAIMFAQLAAPPKSFAPELRDATSRIASAMMAAPEMVAGEKEFDTELMRILKSRVLCKGGAEGMWCASILPCDRWPDGLGIALKIDDGSARARPVVALQILKQLGLLSPEEWARMSAFVEPKITNHRGDIVGRITAEAFA